MKKFAIVLSLIFCFATAAFGQDVKLKILEQPLPELPQNHGTLEVQGTVVLRVQFMDFGDIGEITVVKELPSGLTQRAIVAARKITFEPEKKDGKAVTVTRELQYYYSWNGGWRLPAADADMPALPSAEPGKAEAILASAVRIVGGDRYLNVRSQLGRGKFSQLRDGGVTSFQSFVDAIVFPDKERTEFKGGGSQVIQVNTGDTGWVYDGDQEIIKVQNAAQIANFKQGLRTSLDNLLRGYWKGDAVIAYVGKRAATLGKRNDVIRLTYKDGFEVEFEFASEDALPQKAIYKRTAADGQEFKEEDHYAQFVDVDGVKTPFVVDRFTDGHQTSRINYESVEFNKSISEAVFAKPATPKEAKKDVKY